MWKLKKIFFSRKKSLDCGIYLDEDNKHFGETFSINIDDLKIIR